MSIFLVTLYGYHRWANDDLFEKLETLDQARYAAEMHAALRLINHSYVVARIFAAHLSGTQHQYTSDNTAETPALGELHAAVKVSDEWFVDYVRNIAPGALSEAVPFMFTDGDRGYMTREEMLTHVALHGGYHRGEVGRILSQLSTTPPWDTLAVYLHQVEPARRLQGTEQPVLV
ncbi:damage-inducible protein DinB [Rhizobium sp. Root1203]|uniref:DinB family protein n=1 Tax=Rhizobium sp. Root1203 TaxID=1736427 RepID=UPI00070F9CD5|nr:DinB family protein [Rhizobium sp. Root1203]KQV27542.1 damage-inducible protein DinB [Rhizobium sp. Root1203]